MEAVSKSVRWSAAAELLAVTAVFLIVRAWAKDLEIIGAGSIGVLSAVAAGTLIMKARGRSWSEMGLKPPATMGGWLLVVGYTVVIMAGVLLLVTTVLIPVLTALIPNADTDSGDHFTFLLGRPYFFVTYILTVVWIGAAFGEEMFSRGILMNRLAEVFGNTPLAWGIALFGQAAFFGFAHAYQGLAGIFLTGGIGFILGAFYLLGQRNLWPLILAHGLIDTISLTQFYLANPVS